MEVILISNVDIKGLNMSITEIKITAAARNTTFLVDLSTP